MELISNKIQETKAFQSFEPFVKTLYLKHKNVKVIDDAFTIYNNTGYINPNIGEKFMRILKELIQKFGTYEK